jgi:hypothetical protein
VTRRPLLGPLWTPPGQALDAFASVLSEHWRAARERAAQLLWVSPGNWLEQLRLRAPVTTSRSAGDSSGTPPDPRR